MDLYLDIDGVLLDYNTDTYAKGAIELIEYVTSEFDCYWLTTHCKGDSTPAIEYLTRYFPPEIIEKLKPTYWEDGIQISDRRQLFVRRTRDILWMLSR